MRILLACMTGFGLDLIFGDPYWLYHPIRLIGHLISFLEKPLRSAAGKSPKKQIVAGGILWLLVILISTGIPCLMLWAAEKIHPAVSFLLECFWCYQILAARSLSVESKKVYHALKTQDVEGARKAVSMIVGRDTQSLDEIGVTKAAVETVAENTSDGIIAPLFYMAIGGPVLMFFYKGVNTMDSMVGYKNEKYLNFGRYAAKLDDILNYIPARISAWLMIAGAKLCGFDSKNAVKIFKRDRYNHASPNSAQTEAVMAGALDIQLAGNAYYFGKLCEKPTIGDAIRPVEKEDIPRANQLLYVSAALGTGIFAVIRLGIQGLITLL